VTWAWFILAWVFVLAVVCWRLSKLPPPPDDEFDDDWP
jgi:hypothetical protein